MGIDPTTIFLQHKIQHYKQVNMKKLSEREKECIIPAPRSFGCDRPTRSGASMPCSIGCAGSTLRGL
jgi:hypothetical protein